MKATTPIVFAFALAARAQSAGARELNFGIPDVKEQCENTKNAISNLAEKLLLDNKKALENKFPAKCLTNEKIVNFLKGELHQHYQACSYQDKLEPLNNGQIRFFTNPKKNNYYDPNTQPNILKELAKNKDDFLIKRIGNDFAAVSKSAPESTLRVFKNFNPQDMRLNRPETVSSIMEFLFAAGDGEVPDFDRALYALSGETHFTAFLQKTELKEKFEIPTSIVKTAVENDPELSAVQKEAYIAKLDEAGDKLNIGKNADALGKTIRKAIRSIVDQCPSRMGDLPMRSISLTGSSAFFPMKWSLEPSSNLKNEL